MTNRKNLLITAILCGIAGMAGADNLTKLRMHHPIEVHKPLFTDSIDVRGQKHQLEKILLESMVSLENTADNNSTELMTDTTGLFTIPVSQNKEYSICVLHTRIRTDRFVNSDLKFKTPNRMEVYIDGTRCADKQSREDSIAQAQECTTALRMEPGVTYNVAIKILLEPQDTTEVALSAEWDAKSDSTVSISCGPDIKGRFLLPNTVFGNRVSRVSISPDGKYLLTQYTDKYDLKRSNTYTILSEVKSGKKLATFTQGSKNLNWTPKTSQLYYTATSDNGVKIITIDPKTLQEEVVADNVPEGNFRWSPDEKSLFFSLHETIEGDKKPVHRLLSPSDRVPNTRNRWFISRYDIGTGLRERLTYGLRSSILHDISDNGRYMLYGMSESTPDKWPFSKSSLYRMDLQTRRIDTLIVSDAFMGGASFSPEADKVIITGGPEAFDGIGKNCGSHPIANNYDTQAFILDCATKKIDPITKDFAPTVSFLQWNRYDNCIYFKTSDGDKEPIYRYDPKNGRYEKLPLEGDCVRSFSLAYNAPYAAYTSVTASSSSAGYMFDMKKEKTTLIADPYSESIAEIEMGEIKPWNFTASDGTTIEGYYCLPPEFDETKNYPLIVYYYGGTTPTTRSLDTPYAAQLFASRNYVVYVVNPSGTIGYGQEFSARHVNAWGKRTADDIIEGTRQFCKEHPFVNENKIGCIGASYGGFMTQYLQTRTDLFAAAVSHAGISNVTSYWGEGYWGVGYNAVAAAQSYPWSNPELFTEQGSLFNADKINTPLLLLHGTADTNVPVGESIQLYNALKILGKPVEFIQVDGEDHFVADYTKRTLWHNSIMAWFAKWLQDSPEWWNDIYPEKRLQ